MRELEASRAGRRAAAPDPFADDDTNEPDAFLARPAPRGTNEPEPPLNRTQRRRLAQASRAA
ncbi:hypothetical protein SH611_19615 [Geminicoccaceae bacterium 1502E]|nr:hypothetical protein [Geminicoccaceae bacterium 1502E]